MVTHNMYRTLIGYLFSFVLIAFVTGCGGSGGDAGTETSPFVEKYIEIEAVPGPIVGVRVGEVAVLDDGTSYARSNEPLSYSWSFTHRPEGSNAVLQDATSATPSFVADVRGVYMLQLVVSAEGVSSQRAVTTVVATVHPERLTGPFRHEGLSSNCVNCHFEGFNASIPIKTPNHVAAGNACQTCHTPQGFAILPFVDHQEVFGNCSECHNGTVAIGKSEFHQPTDAECDDCHNTTAFIELNPDGSFDHSNITRSCSGCHNGSVATGMTPTTADTPPGTHPVTNSECGYCHTTDSFLNAYPDHTDPAVVGAGCDSCHVADGSGSARGQSIGHPLTNVDCDSCHSIVSFKMPGGIFNHSLLDATVQPCESCHNANTSINARAATPTVTHQNTTSDCGVCHSTESFTPAFSIDHSDPAVLAARCDSCHGVTASGKPITTLFYEHMPTNEDCKVCHTPGTFSTGTFDHSGPSYVGSCDSCHNNVIGVGKLPNHIPTTPNDQDCAVCHNTIDFAAAVFDHASTNTSNCLACHDGNISIGKTFDHVSTSLNCSSCHNVNSSFSTFAGTFVHDLNIVGGDCASCHNTGIATPKQPNHIPAQAECSVCHSDMSTGGFTLSTFMSNVHPGIAGGCEGCHNGRFSTISGNLYGKPFTHIPTGQDCDVCHTNASFMAPTNFSHVGITGNCTSCHDGSYISPAGALGKISDPTPPHPATTQDCGVCHNTNSFSDATFDHTGRTDNCAECHGDNATGAVSKKHAGHVPTTQDCSLCHVPGTFVTAVFDHTGIVNNCVSCHAGAGAIATVKHNGHLPTTEDCSVCHNTTAFAGARFDHRGIVNNCASCHDGATARGKTPPPDHVPTTQDCNLCHQTTGFIPATFDHAGIVNNCRSCHNGAFATGKTGDHVPTNQDCGVCHNTRTFIGAVFDHTGIVNNCASCHDGSTAIGMDAKTNPAHIPTALDCHSCHTTASFIGGTWTHDSSSAGNCSQCHSPGGGARSKPSGHLNTIEQCDVCHSTNSWAPSNFRHSSQGNYPGDHRWDPGCNGCHKGSKSAGINSDNYPNQLRYAPFCAGCHAGDFESEGDHIGGRNGTIEQNKNCGASGCHRVSSSGF